MNCGEIRKAILSIKEPFCQQDLFNMLKGVNRDAILNSLDYLYDYRLVDYKQVNGRLAYVITP